MQSHDKMRWIMFLVFLILFVSATVCTLSAVFFQIGSPTDDERTLLLRVFVIEIAAAVIALFYSLFGLSRAKKVESQNAIGEPLHSQIVAMPINKPPGSKFYSSLWDSLAPKTLILFGVEPQGTTHPRISQNDLSAAFQISIFLATAYPKKSAIPISSVTAGWQNHLSLDSSLVLVAGFMTNPEYSMQITRLRRYFSLKMGRICDQSNQRCYHVNFSSLPPHLKTIPRHYPHQIDAIPSKHVSRDYALITATTATLYAAQRRVVTVAGIKGPGTVGGASYITTEAMLKDLEYHLKDKVSFSDILELLVRVDINAGVVNSTTLVSMAINGQCVLPPKEDEWEPCEHVNSCNKCTFGNAPSHLTPIVKSNRTTFGAIIFDLDDTLVDTYETLITTAEVNAANQFCCETECTSSVGEISSFLLSLRRRAPHKISEEIKARYPDFSADIERTRTRSLQDLNVRNLHLKAGAIDLLKDAGRLFDLYLITEGPREFQESKIEYLGISSYFKRVIIVSKEEDNSKKEAIEQLLTSTAIPHDHIAVVGNRIDNEIRIGNQLGLTTVWMKCGEGSDMSPDRDNPPHHIVTGTSGIHPLVKEPGMLWHFGR